MKLIKRLLEEFDTVIIEKSLNDGYFAVYVDKSHTGLSVSYEASEDDNVIQSVVDRFKRIKP
jgi:hypothetical protein